MDTGAIIKALRIQAGMSQQELALKSGYNDRSSIAKIESGKVDLPESKIKLFSEIFGVTPAEIMGLYPESQSHSTPPASNGDEAVNRESDPIYDALNAKGRKEFCRYGRYLTTLEEYRAPEEHESQVAYIRHYLVPAAAGYASPIEGEEYEDIPLPDDAPLNADFCITVRGDSMEPYIHDGQLVYVQRGAELHDFDPGIFFVDGDVFCKQWCPGYMGESYLLSANPLREDANIIISRDDGRHCVYFGKVLLKKKLPPPHYR